MAEDDERTKRLEAHVDELCQKKLKGDLRFEDVCFPMRDFRLDKMYMHPAEEMKQDFSRRIPRSIHQIWLGTKPQPQGIALWEAYAKRCEYGYKCWTNGDMKEIEKLIVLCGGQENWKWFTRGLKDEDYWLCADILRYHLLLQKGGIYVDCDFNPKAEAEDFSNWILMQGIHFVPEWCARGIDTFALFVGNSVIMSCPNHRIMLRVIKSIPKTCENLFDDRETLDWCERASVCTGPFLLNKCLTGAFSLITPSSLAQHVQW
jgi:mannosyltransferase OCH1-like enzyme